jgi:hypothetical protein
LEVLYKMADRREVVGRKRLKMRGGSILNAWSQEGSPSFEDLTESECLVDILSGLSQEYQRPDPIGAL